MGTADRVKLFTVTRLRSTRFHDTFTFSPAEKSHQYPDPPMKSPPKKPS